MFSVATNFDDMLPERLQDLGVEELFGSCDETPVGHGRPRAVTPPVSWRQLERHVGECRRFGIGFNLLLNPLCLSGLEESAALEKRIRKTLTKAMDMGVTGVTIAHPWMAELCRETTLKIRVSVFVGISTIEQAKYWEDLGCHVLALDTHVVCRDLPRIRDIATACGALIELPVNIGCLLRCPLARTHAARLSHSSVPGAQPLDPCVRWCLEEKRKHPVNLVRSDFIRPEDLERYREAGAQRFKIVDRSCSTEALVERVVAYANGQWDGDLLRLLGHNGRPPRHRRLPIFDALRHLGLRRSMRALKEAPELMSPTLPWVMDNKALEGLVLPKGCNATNCDSCGHCARLAAVAVRKSPVPTG